MKKIIAFMLVLILALSCTACGGTNISNTDSNNSTANSDALDKTTSATDDESSVPEESTVEKTVKSDGYDKFSQLEIGMTESAVNAILGEPVRVDKAYYYYTITVNGNDLELEVWINTVSGLVTYINGAFDKSEYRAEFVDDATDLSKVDGLESGEINTYDACVSTFKTAGFLMNIDKDGTKTYLWVNTADGYMRVVIDADGNVKKYSGFC